jgi:hypothetical protein
MSGISTCRYDGLWLALGRVRAHNPLVCSRSHHNRALDPSRMTVAICGGNFASLFCAMLNILSSDHLIVGLYPTSGKGEHADILRYLHRRAIKPVSPWHQEVDITQFALRVFIKSDFLYDDTKERS